jgi:hypothetical protein
VCKWSIHPIQPIHTPSNSHNPKSWQYSLGLLLPATCIFSYTVIHVKKFWKPSAIRGQVSESELLYDCRFTANQFVLAPSPLRPTTSHFIFQLITYCYSPYVTSSLTRGWVCRLQLLLALASAVILRFESRGTHNHILLSQIRDSPNLEDQVPVFISPKNRVALLYPQELGCLFIASYDSQGYGGGIRPRIHGQVSAAGSRYRALAWIA